MQSESRIENLVYQYFGLPPEQQAQLTGSLEQVRLDGGEWLFHHGDAGDALYLLVRGRLQVWAERDHLGPLDSPRLIGGVAPGESVGEIALLTGAPRTAGIRASRDSLLLRVSRTTFEQWAGKRPELGLRLASRAASLVAQPDKSQLGSTRNLGAITLLPLGSGDRIREFCGALMRRLKAEAGACPVRRDELASLGAPQDWPDGRQPAPEGMTGWVHALEERGGMLVFLAEPGETEWARFAIRQSDLVVLVGDADDDPRPAEWERTLGLHENGSLLRRMLVLLQGASEDSIRGTASWYRGRGLEFHLHVRSGNAGDIERVGRVLTGKATGLVLGAGASRGFAHLGVYRALSEAGVAVDWVAGTSIGAIMGATIAFDWGPQNAINAIRAAFVKGKPFSDYTVPVMSLLSGRRMRRLLNRSADWEIEDLPLPFLCLSSRLDDGGRNLHRAGNLARALRASASMPGIFPPTVVDGRLSVDGSVLNSLPVDLMWQQPVGRVIAVSLAEHQQRRVEYAETPSPWSVLMGRLVPFAPRHRVPALITVMLKSTELATLRNVEEQGQRASLLLRPDVKRFALTRVRAFDQIVEAGYVCARQALEDWSGPESP
ncbi:patatin-like phospholipase family protein [Elongatibacter sediminis]|uniref:Patatin-like phospholipase family protein n=1 Tax=Elongatibacter sediminis TaxID=3119006 RepID=A0AAW9RE81_9GAMM